MYLVKPEEVLAYLNMLPDDTMVSWQSIYSGSRMLTTWRVGLIREAWLEAGIGVFPNGYMLVVYGKDDEDHT